MPKKQAGTIHLELPSSSLSPNNAGLVAVPVASLTRGSRQLTDEEAFISNKLRTDLAVQLGYAIKGEHGQHLTQLVTQRGLTRFAEYLEFDRAILDRPWANADDQADMVAFAIAMRQAQANTQIGIRNGVVNRIEEAAITPLEPPEKQGEDVIIEKKPGLLGALFGGIEVTRVKR